MTVFASKGEYSAEKVFSSLDHLIVSFVSKLTSTLSLRPILILPNRITILQQSPQDKRYDEIHYLLKEGNLLNEYEDPIRRQRAKQAVRNIMEYLYQHDWYLRHRDNWGKIWDKFEQLDRGVGEVSKTVSSSSLSVRI